MNCKQSQILVSALKVINFLPAAVIDRSEILGVILRSYSAGSHCRSRSKNNLKIPFLTGAQDLLFEQDLLPEQGLLLEQHLQYR